MDTPNPRMPLFRTRVQSGVRSVQMKSNQTKHTVLLYAGFVLSLERLLFPLLSFLPSST